MNTKTKEKIQNELIGTKFSGVLNTEEKLKNITGNKWTCYDKCIDDGADDDDTEDSYVMRASFEDEENNIVRIYYGDVTEEIGYVDVCSDAI